MNDWLKSHAQGSTLLLYVQPGASKTTIAGEHGGRLKLKISAPPRDGEANQAVIEFMAEILGVAKAKVHFIRGESSRQKDILVELPPEKIFILLKDLI